MAKRKRVLSTQDRHDEEDPSELQSPTSASQRGHKKVRWEGNSEEDDPNTEDDQTDEEAESVVSEKVSPLV